MKDMETTMELDEMKLAELKLAWQALDRRLEQHNALNLHIFRAGKLDKVRANLRRLYWGKIVQILCGDAMIYFGIMSVIRYRDVPHLLACGALMLTYGALIVVLGGVTLGKISGIDYAAPVLDIQKRVGTLHRIQDINNLSAGLPWWFLWIAIFVLEAKANLGVDLYLAAPAFVWTNIAIGVAGTLATLWFYRRARNPRNPRLSAALDNATLPRSLRDAQGTLDEIARFERD